MESAVAKRDLQLKQVPNGSLASLVIWVDLQGPEVSESGRTPL